MKPDEIRARRKALGFTQAQLAHALGVRMMAVSRWERGVVSMNETASRLLQMLTPDPKKGGGRKR